MLCNMISFFHVWRLEVNQMVQVCFSIQTLEFVGGELTVKYKPTFFHAEPPAIRYTSASAANMHL